MSGDPQYSHFGGPLHVKVETFAPAHIAYQRVTGVLEELSKLLQPVSYLMFVLFTCVIFQIREDTTPSHLKDKESNNDDKKDGVKSEGDNNNGNGNNDGPGPMRSHRGGRGGGGGGGFRGGPPGGGFGRGGGPPGGFNRGGGGGGRPFSRGRGG